MKKSFFLILAAICSLSSCGTEPSSSEGISYPDSDKYLFGNKTYSETIDTLNVYFTSGKVDISKGKQLTISESNNLKESLCVHHLLEGSTLNVHDVGAGPVSSYTYIKDVDISVPNALNSMNFDVMSCSATSTVDVKEVSVKSVSGDVSLTSSTLETLSISVVSASIDLYIPKDKTLTINQRNLASGSVNGEYVVGDDISITISGTAGELNIYQINN